MASFSKRIRRLVVLGDTHFDYASTSLDRALAACEGADAVLQVGDLYDLYVFSRYTKDPKLAAADLDSTKARDAAEKMWAEVRKRARKGAALFQLRGNHDQRVDKRIAESLPEVRSLAGPRIRDLYTFPGVETIHDPTEELFLNLNGDRAVAIHGHRSRLGEHAAYNQIATICGHSHTGGAVYLRHRSRVFWELNAGWLGNEKAPVFAYGNQRILKRWTLGYGVVDGMGPRFCPLKPGRTR